MRYIEAETYIMNKECKLFGLNAAFAKKAYIRLLFVSNFQYIEFNR
jgi:hypothetical protein